ncbi:MAG: hypothetical protein AB7D38_12205 [Sulfurimonas sp.]|uniref:hypothetical protein n=1 Tax=Sulfurimonas sp. TaxID=2022749 RepID=UPI003D0E89DE
MFTKILMTLLIRVGFWVFGKAAKGALQIAMAAVDEVESIDWSDKFGTDKSEAKRAEAFERVKARLKAEGIAVVGAVRDSAREVSVSQVYNLIEYCVSNIKK